MRRIMPSTAFTVAVTMVSMTALTVLAGGFADPRAGGGPDGIKGREVIKIVTTLPGPRHGRVTASGAFRANGYFVRKRATLVFPNGRLAIRRHLLGTTYTPPNLATCWFKIRQNGTFTVFSATGRYRGLRYGGQFWTNISGRLKRSGPDQCGSKLVFYRTVTYEIGTIP